MSSEIGFLERHETPADENNNYMHRIGYVSKLKRKVFSCVSEEIIIEWAISKAKSTTEESASIIHTMDGFQDVNVFCKRCIMHENNLQGSFQEKKEVWFHKLAYGSVRICV